MKRFLFLALFAVLLAALSVTAFADDDDYDEDFVVNGQWTLTGTQTNDIGTDEEHEYSYQRKVRWSYSDGVFYQDGNDYDNAEFDGETLTAEYDKMGEEVSVTIVFLDDDTAEYTREGYNDAFGDYEITATATRVE